MGTWTYLEKDRKIGIQSTYLSFVFEHFHDISKSHCTGETAYAITCAECAPHSLLFLRACLVWNRAMNDSGLEWVFGSFGEISSKILQRHLLSLSLLQTLAHALNQIWNPWATLHSKQNSWASRAEKAGRRSFVTGRCRCRNWFASDSTVRVRWCDSDFNRGNSKMARWHLLKMGCYCLKNKPRIQNLLDRTTVTVS